MNQVLEVFLTNILPTIVVGFVGWFFGRRKTNAEATTNELENVERAITIWRKQCEDLSTQIKAFRANEIKLLKEIQLLRQDFEDHKNLMEDLTEENKQLKAKIKG